MPRIKAFHAADLGITMETIHSCHLPYGEGVFVPYKVTTRNTNEVDVALIAKGCRNGEWVILGMGSTIATLLKSINGKPWYK